MASDTTSSTASNPIMFKYRPYSPFQGLVMPGLGLGGLTLGAGMILLTLGLSGLVDNPQPYSISGTVLFIVGAILLVVNLPIAGVSLIKSYADTILGKTSLIVLAVLVVVGVIAGLVYAGDTGKTVATYAGAFILLLIAIFGATYFSQEKITENKGFDPSTLFRMLYYFLPYGIVTYTTMADIFNMKFKYSAAIITAIITFILNHLIAYYGLTPPDVDRTVTPLKDSNYCGIPGLGSFGSNLFPQAMLFNLTALSHLASLITAETNQDPKYTAPIWTFLLATFFASSAASVANGCFDEKIGHSYFITNKLIAAGVSKTAAISATLVATLAVSLMLGAAGGLTAWGVTKEGFAGYVDPKAEKDAKNKQNENIVNVSTALSEVCPAIAEDQIVAEIYQNGKKLGSSQNN